MSGRWTLKHQWGDMEEYWSQPMGDNLMSSYRCVKDGKVIFYEFVVIEQEGDSPVMKMRHFNRGNIAWEQKNAPQQYKMISISANKVTFASPDKQVKLSYQRTASNKLVVTLDEKDKKGNPHTELFNYTLQANDPGTAGLVGP